VAIPGRGSEDKNNEQTEAGNQRVVMIAAEARAEQGIALCSTEEKEVMDKLKFNGKYKTIGRHWFHPGEQSQESRAELAEGRIQIVASKSKE
jgi:hypothetical protein